MPNNLKLPPLDLGHETIGRRFARVRKERGDHHEVELATSWGIPNWRSSAVPRPARCMKKRLNLANLSGGPLDHPSRRGSTSGRLPGCAECR